MLFLGYDLTVSLLIFQVMIQRHNRHMSISYYISVLAVTDTMALLIGKFEVITVTHTLIRPTVLIKCSISMKSCFRAVCPPQDNIRDMFFAFHTKLPDMSDMVNPRILQQQNKLPPVRLDMMITGSKV